jgi:hypothetical protein
MPKVKTKYPKAYVTRVLNSIPGSQLLTMKHCVQIGYTPSKLIKEFRVKESWAQIVYFLYKIPEKGPIEHRLGSKTEPYYEKESDMIIPEYKLEDLTGDELKMSEKLWEE